LRTEKLPARQREALAHAQGRGKCEARADLLSEMAYE